MDNHLSSFFSDDQLRTSLIYKSSDGYVVYYLDSLSGKEKKAYFSDLQQAENFAEDWVL